MRTLIAAALAGAAIASLAACSKPAAGPAGPSSAAAGPAPVASGPLTADQIPHRKPGLWSQTMAMDGAAGGPGMQFCVDAASEARTSLAAQNIPGAKCDNQLSRNLDGSLSVSGSCDMGANGKVQSTGVIKGDFNTGYTMTMDSTYSGSPVQAMNGKHTMTITAAWTGPCAPGEKGGDIILPNGMKVNALDHMAAPPPSGGN
jgi:hypothetical protein